jgi:hypothetical protein
MGIRYLWGWKLLKIGKANRFDFSELKVQRGVILVTLKIDDLIKAQCGRHYFKAAFFVLLWDLFFFEKWENFRDKSILFQIWEKKNLRKSSIADKSIQLEFNNSNQILTYDKVSQNIEVAFNGFMMEILDDSSMVDLQFCILREMLNNNPKKCQMKSLKLAINHSNSSSSTCKMCNSPWIIGAKNTAVILKKATPLYKA